MTKCPHFLVAIYDRSHPLITASHFAISENIPAQRCLLARDHEGPHDAGIGIEWP